MNNFPQHNYYCALVKCLHGHKPTIKRYLSLRSSTHFVFCPIARHSMGPLPPFPYGNHIIVEINVVAEASGGVPVALGQG